MVSLIFFATRAPSELAAELSHQGYEVFEALAISEVLHLLDSHSIDAVLIAGEVEKDLAEVQGRTVTLRLNAGTTAREVLWELSHLFGVKESIQ
jgi:hypothetical protein